MSVDRASQHRQCQEHDHDCTDASDRKRQYSGNIARLNGHKLVAIDEWLPGTEPTPYEIDLTDGSEYRTRYWCCRNCSQERNRRDGFIDRCESPDPPTPLEAGRYTIDDPRTRRI